jgi:hypothetical protein
MNNYKNLIFVVTLTLISIASYGQKWKNDPSYSIHNYKHPNKADLAKKADLARLEEIPYVKAMVPVSRNYKAQNLQIARKPEVVSVISVPSRNATTNRNYKQQFAPSGRKH